MTRAEIIRRLRAGEVGHSIDVAIAKLLLPKDVHVPPYTGSVDAALAAPIADGWALVEMVQIDDGIWRTVARKLTANTVVASIHDDAPTLPAAIMIAKLLTFNGGQE